MKKESLNEYDMAKDMLKTLREYDSSMNDMIELPSSERKIAEDTFRQHMGQIVKFTVFNIYPRDENVVFGGVFSKLDNLEWQFSLEDGNGIFINCKNVKLTPILVETIKRLHGYYDEWSKEWGEKVFDYKDNKNI